MSRTVWEHRFYAHRHVSNNGKNGEYVLQSTHVQQNATLGNAASTSSILKSELPHQKNNNLHMRKQRRRSAVVTAQLISAFVFATQIVQSLCFFNLKFQASSLLQSTAWFVLETKIVGFLMLRLCPNTIIDVVAFGAV